MRKPVALAFLLTLVTAASVLGGERLRSPRYEMPWLVMTGGGEHMESPNFTMESRVVMQPVESARSSSFRLHAIPRPGGPARPVLVVSAGASRGGRDARRSPDPGRSFGLLRERYR